MVETDMLSYLIWFTRDCPPATSVALVGNSAYVYRLGTLCYTAVNNNRARVHGATTVSAAMTMQGTNSGDLLRAPYQTGASRYYYPRAELGCLDIVVTGIQYHNQSLE